MFTGFIVNRCILLFIKKLYQIINPNKQNTDNNIKIFDNKNIV